MKNLDQITKNLEAFEKKFGMKCIGAEQGSAIWFNLKLGVLSASNASQIVAKKESETRLTYMSELVAQIATGVMEEINSKYLDWGSQHEAAARASYEFKENCEITPLCFVFKDDKFREGCSPDGIVNSEKGVEIKTPFNAVHYVKFLCEDKIKPEYFYQYQYTMRVMECDSWDFCQYHPLMKRKPLKVLTVKRDDDTQKKFDDMVPEFILDMDKMLAKIGIEFGEQWLRLGGK